MNESNLSRITDIKSSLNWSTEDRLQHHVDFTLESQTGLLQFRVRSEEPPHEVRRDRRCDVIEVAVKSVLLPHFPLQLQHRPKSRCHGPFLELEGQPFSFYDAFQLLWGVRQKVEGVQQYQVDHNVEKIKLGHLFVFQFFHDSTPVIGVGAEIDHFVVHVGEFGAVPVSCAQN